MMSATQYAGERTLADAQQLSGFRTKVIRGAKSQITDFAWILPDIKRSTLETWRADLIQSTGAQSLFFDDTDAHLTTAAINFDEAELAPSIVEGLRRKTQIWYDECTDLKPASDTTATFTLIPHGKRIKIDMCKL